MRYMIRWQNENKLQYNDNDTPLQENTNTKKRIYLHEGSIVARRDDFVKEDPHQEEPARRQVFDFHRLGRKIKHAPITTINKEAPAAVPCPPYLR